MIGVIIVTLILALSALGFSLSLSFLSGLLPYLTNIIFSVIAVAIGSFLILFGVIFAGANPRTGRVLAYIGLGIFIIGLFIAEMAYVAKVSTVASTPMVVRCASAPTGGGSGLFSRVGSPAEFISCIITGYKYAGMYSGYAFVGFWIFGVVIPVLLLMFLFYDFVDASGVIRTPKSKKVVGYCLGLIAYRGFVVANLLEVLSIGTVGIALLAINFIFAGGILAYINRVFEQWRPIEDAMGTIRSTGRMNKLLHRLAGEAIHACDAKDLATVKGLLDDMYHLAITRPDWLHDVNEAREKAQDPTKLPEVQAVLEKLRSKTTA